jgi:glycosyltransferase involved in cell wall biosynthesis
MVVAKQALELFESTSDYAVIICAYNEARNLERLLPCLDSDKVIVVDDGSTDDTSAVVRSCGLQAVTTGERRGKTTALRRGLELAKAKNVSQVVVLDADAFPDGAAIVRLVEALSQDDVGGSTLRQVPFGRFGIVGRIEDLMWSTLYWAKDYQMRVHHDCYIGGIMLACKTKYVQVEDLVNDDEMIGLHLRSHGLRTVLVRGPVVRFDVSNNLHELVERRRRMFFGHIIHPASQAPSRNKVVTLTALAMAVKEGPARLLWVVPAAVVEIIARLQAWQDYRLGRLDKYKRWVNATKNLNTNRRNLTSS